MTLATDVLEGNRRALARLITQIENEPASAQEALAFLYPQTGRAHLIGVTGAPGTGKSSVVARLAQHYRAAGETVGILAVDPSSPFSGGAILGDRIRMRDLAGDPGVFIRSMASRGDLGGLARAADDVIRAMDAAGFQRVLIETVGAGQSEVEIARHAHTVLVIEAPGLGDDVQAIKAGILEIADLLVVNKMDDPRSGATLKALRAMLDLAHPEAPRTISHHGRLMELAASTNNRQPAEAWAVPIQLTNGLSGEGISELAAQIEVHRDYLRDSGELARRELARLGYELERRLRDALLDRLLAQIDAHALRGAVEAMQARSLSPAEAVATLLADSPGTMGDG